MPFSPHAPGTRSGPSLNRRSACATAWLCLGLAGTAQAAGQTVTIRNGQLKVMKELRTGAELAEFNRYWAAKQPTNQTTDQVNDWSFTFDIVSGGKAERWLYQSNGATARVDSRAQRVFLLKNPAAFNTLVGAPRY